MNEQSIYVLPDGTIETIGDAPPEIGMMGETRRARASSIVPLHLGKRLAFLLLRTVFGERGITAEWTRQWQGPWLTLVYETGETFEHQSRRVCVEWERERLAAVREAP